MNKENYTKIQNILESLYEKAERIYYGNGAVNIEEDLKNYLDTILGRSEENKAVLSVLITLIVYKLYNPSQNIKLHRAEFDGGFSGRTIDTKCVTPFMKSKGFPAMAESGWLTRSLEQPHPYDFDYPGKIRPEKVKHAFLSIVHEVEDNGRNPENMLLYIFTKLLAIRDSKAVKLPRPVNLTIEEIIDKLNRHFSFVYYSSGKSRLPVLAVYALYKILVREFKRYVGKNLLELLPHESPDERTGMLGDIQIVDQDGRIYEVVEIKDRPIDYGIVISAFEKLKKSPPERYYILTTYDYSLDTKVKNIINQCRSIYGTIIIVNGVIPTIKYYLRLVEKPSEFVELYVDLLERDPNVKREHKDAWVQLCS